MLSNNRDTREIVMFNIVQEINFEQDKFSNLFNKIETLQFF